MTDSYIENSNNSCSRRNVNRKKKEKSTKPIKKKNKYKRKSKKNNAVIQARVEEINEPIQQTFNYFAFLQSEQQKYRRVELYFKADIQQYYRTNITDDEIQELKNVYIQNEIKMKDVLKNNVIEIWKDVKCYLLDLLTYFDLVSKCQQHSNSYYLFQNKEKTKHYCCFFEECQALVYEINQLEMELLKERKNFFCSFSKNHT